MFKFKSIKTKITAIAGFLLIVVGIVILLTSLYLVRKSFDEQVNSDMTVISGQAADELSVAMKNTTSIITELANNVIISDDDFTQADKVDFYESRAKELGYKLFFTTDEKGMATNLTKSGDKMDVSANEYFKKSIAGESYVSSIITDQLTGDKIIIVSAPYYKNGKIAGIFAGIQDISFISNMCSNFKWGNSGIIAVYDKETNLIGHSNQELVKSGLNIFEMSAQDSTYKDVNSFFTDKVQKLDSGVGKYFFNGADKLSGFHNINDLGFL